MGGNTDRRYTEQLATYNYLNVENKMSLMQDLCLND